MSLIAAGASTSASFGAAVVIAAFVAVLILLVMAELRGWR